MKSSLELVSNRNPAEGEAAVAVEQKALNLRDKLISLHDVLHEYREVEAREKLIATMLKQVEEAERVEATLARYGIIEYIVCMTVVNVLYE